MKKPKITPGKWYAVNYAGYINIQNRDVYDSHCDVLDCEDHEEAPANGDFICMAKDIFEQGYNIETMPELVETLGLIRHRIELGLIKARVKDVELIEKALKKAKFE